MMREILSQTQTCGDADIWDAFLSAYKYPALIAADRIGLFTCLRHSDSDLNSLSESLGIKRRGLEALIGTLASMNFIRFDGQVASLSEAARIYLLPDSPLYWGHMFRFDEKNPVTPFGLIDALKRQSPHAYDGLDLWTEHEANSDHAVRFTRAMHSHSFPSAIALANEFTLKAVSRLLDVGGGSGCFSIAFALSNPQIHCVVADRPYVCRVSKEYIEEFDVSDQVETLAFDMFNDPWPDGYDAVFMSNLLHDWDHVVCQDLLNAAFACLPEGGSLFIHEMLLNDERNGPWPATAFSLTMLRFTEGKQYSLKELDELLAIAGFVNIHSFQSVSGFYLISAKRKERK
jgi:cyclopropane fatty-acyl-phospholipid synthase-like methyltransferase